MLKTGEMMQITEECSYKGEVIIKSYESFFSLSNIQNEWSSKIILKGEKLPTGITYNIKAK